MSKSRKRRSRELAEKLVKLGFKWFPEYQSWPTLAPSQQRSMIKRKMIEANIREGCHWMTMAHSGGIRCWSFIIPGVRLSDIAAVGLPSGMYEKHGEDSVRFMCDTRKDVHLVLDYLEQLRIIAKQ